MQKQFLQNWRKNILDKYKVKVNPRAIRELDSIYEYIANEKLSPENAKGQDARIKKAILSLDTQICGIFNKTQPIESDFDNIVKGLAKKKIITFPDYVIMIQLWKIVFYESNKSLRKESKVVQTKKQY